MNILSVVNATSRLLVYSPYFINEDTEAQKETKSLAQSLMVKVRQTKTIVSVFGVKSVSLVTLTMPQICPLYRGNNTASISKGNKRNE